MSTFDDYLATVPDPQKAALEGVCGYVRSAVPGPRRALVYGMPAFKYTNRPLLGFKASKNHLSVYPFSPEAVEAARPALAGFDLGKGTVRFTVTARRTNEEPVEIRSNAFRLPDPKEEER